MTNDNKKLITAVNILNRVETLLDRNSRVQISKENLSLISEYLAKAIKYIPTDISIFGNQLIVFGKCIESLQDVLDKNDIVALNFDTKQYLVENIYSTILEFKINVGKYLTYEKFEYSPAMDKVIKNIIDTCIDNGYYFDY